MLPIDAYEVRPRKDKRGIDLISDALPFRRLWYTELSDAVDYAKFYSRSNDAVIRVYDAAGNVLETHTNGRGVKKERRCFYRHLHSQPRSSSWHFAPRFRDKNNKKANVFLRLTQYERPAGVRAALSPNTGEKVVADQGDVGWPFGMLTEY